MIERPLHVRRFLRGRRGIVASYQAIWHGRGFPQEKLAIRIDRSRKQCRITGHVLEFVAGEVWQPARTQARLLTPVEWEQVSTWLEFGFWGLSSRDTETPVMDGDCWWIEGYREGNHHFVYRHTGSVVDGSGAEVYELGRRLATLAGLRRFEQTVEGNGHPTV